MTENRNSDLRMMTWEETAPKGGLFPYALRASNGIVPYDLIEPIKRFCAEVFGEGSFGGPDRQWTFNADHGYLAFKTEMDRFMFATSWSGRFEKGE